MALVEDPYFVTDDPYGGGYEQDEEEEMVEEVIDPDLEEDPSRQADELAEDAGEEEVPYEEPEEEAENWPEEEVVGVEQPEQPLEEEAWEENVEEEAYLDETNAQVEADLGDEPGEEPWAEEVHEEPLEAEAQEPGFEEEETLDLPAEVEVEPCSPGLDVEPEDEGLGFRTTLDEVDYTPFEPEEHAEEDESDEEPAWLKGIGILDPKAAEDADVSAAFLDGLTGSQTDLDLAFPQYIPSLARYLVGHPEALVTKKKKGHRKGAGKRYFGGEDRSEDVMADKVVTGCWACGKLDHESQECAFKRCFVCSEQGHELSECRWRNIFCKRCGRQGHLADNCPVEAYDESFYKVNDTDDVSFTRCLKCGDEGHINCGNPADLPFVEAETNQYEHYQERRDDWSSQGQGWNENHWQPKHAMHMAAAWMMQGMQGMSLPVGPAMDWAPPAGDGGGYDKGDEEHGGYGYGGRRWPRTGNSKGWGGQRWNGGGWGRSQSWDGGGWGGWDGGPSHKRRRH